MHDRVRAICRRHDGAVARGRGVAALHAHERRRGDQGLQSLTTTTRSAEQMQMTSRHAREPRRRESSETAQPAAHEHAVADAASEHVVAHRPRRAHHDLAHVSRLRHLTQRGVRPHERVSGGTQRPVLHGARAHGDAVHALAHRGLWQEVHRHQPQRRIRSLSAERRRRPDVALANLHETSARGHAADGRRHDARGRERVEHHVDGSERHRRHVRERRRARAADVAHRRRVRSHPVTLRARARGRVHRRVQCAGELCRSHAHAARRGVDQHALAAARASRLAQREVHRHEDSWHARRRLVPQMRG